MQDEDLLDFSRQIADKTALSVDPLIPTNRPPCMMERSEYRKVHKMETSGSEIVSEKISVGKYSGLLEKDMDTVRLSLCLQWRNAEGCWTAVLDSRIQTAFYDRLSRSSVVDWLRKTPVENFDLTFLFTAGDDPEKVRMFLMEAILAWRNVTRQIRVRQMIANRRCANSLFEKIRFSPVSKNPDNITAPSVLATPCRSPNRHGGAANDNWSVRTDACDVCSIAEIDDLIKEIENDSNLINFDIEE